MALNTSVLPIFSVILACLVATSSVVGQDEAEAEVTTVSGVLGGDVQMSCDVPFASSPQVAWKDTVYNMKRGPAVIYEDGEHKQDHMHAERFSVSADFTLTISDLIDDDVGEYFCESTLGDGSTEVKTYSVVLIVPPKCEGETALTEGDDIQLTCSASFTGSGGDMAWYVGDERLESRDETSLTELLITFAEKATGKYDKKKLICKLMVGDRNFNCSKSMDVQYSPKVDFPGVTASEESTAVITCNAPSNPTPTIIKLFKINADDETETELESGDGVTVDVDGDSGVASVTFSSLSPKHAGNYRCTASNALGEDSGTATLLVTDKPPVPTTPEPTPEPQNPDKESSNSGNQTPGGDASLVRHSLLLMLSACLVVLHLL